MYLATLAESLGLLLEEKDGEKVPEFPMLHNLRHHYHLKLTVSQYARLLHFDLSPVREHDIDIIGCPATVHARIVLPHLLDDQFT